MDVAWHTDDATECIYGFFLVGGGGLALMNNLTTN